MTASPAGETWTIQANPTATADRHYYGFRVDGAIESAAEALVTKPHLIHWIHDVQLTNFGIFFDLSNPVTLDFGFVLITQPDSNLRTYGFRNVGTGPLNITAATPAPPLPYVIENYPLPPLTVLPMDDLLRLVRFRPTFLGPAPVARVTLTTNDGAKHLDLSGTAVSVLPQ